MMIFCKIPQQLLLNFNNFTRTTKVESDYIYHNFLVVINLILLLVVLEITEIQQELLGNITESDLKNFNIIIKYL
jgi:hypothetical protein